MNASRTRPLAVLSLCAFALFCLAVLLLHFIRPDIDPLRFGISFYALGSFGWMLRIAISILGVGGLCLAFALWPLIHRRSGRVGLGLLFLWAFSNFLAAWFSVDAPGSTSTLAGTIHNLSGLNFLLILPAAILIDRDLSQPSQRPGRSSLRVLLPWSILVSSVLLFTFNGPLNGLGLGGAFQRLYWLTVILWLVVVAWEGMHVSEPVAVGTAPV